MPTAARLKRRKSREARGFVFHSCCLSTRAFLPPLLALVEAAALTGCWGKGSLYRHVVTTAPSSPRGDQ